MDLNEAKLFCHFSDFLGSPTEKDVRCNMRYSLGLFSFLLDTSWPSVGFWICARRRTSYEAMSWAPTTCRGRTSPIGASSRLVPPGSGTGEELFLFWGVWGKQRRVDKTRDGDSATGKREGKYLKENSYIGDS